MILRTERGTPVKREEKRPENSDDRREYKSGSRGDESDRTRDAFPRRRPRPPADLIFDYKDPGGIRPFLTDTGAIVPARVSRLSRKQQRQLTREVKRSQVLALLPLSDRHSKQPTERM